MIAVTTSLKGSEKYEIEAKRIANLLDINYYPRNSLSAVKFCQRHNLEAYLQIGGDGAVLINSENKKHGFHLGMAELRIQNLIKGHEDHLITAIGKDCRSLLDCTLGLGIDSIVASYGLPKLEKITGIEGCEPLAFITNEGYRNYHHENEDINTALRKIQVLAMNYIDYLNSIPDKSYDVIYFDPMFKHGVKESTQFDGLRNIVINNGLDEEIIEIAKRKARKRVIIKERIFSQVFKRFKIDQEVGGKYSRIKYGVLNINE